VPECPWFDRCVAPRLGAGQSAIPMDDDGSGARPERVRHTPIVVRGGWLAQGRRSAATGDRFLVGGEESHRILGEPWSSWTLQRGSAARTPGGESCTCHRRRPDPGPSTLFLVRPPSGDSIRERHGPLSMDTREGENMAAAQASRNERLIETIDRAEQSALEALRKFLDTIDDAFPHLREDKPRRKALDSLFKMIEQLVAAATGLAKNIVVVTQTESEPTTKRAIGPAKAAKATKATKSTKKAATKKATAKRSPSTR